MVQQAKAKIFLADQRGVFETSSWSSSRTFNFKEYYNEHKSGLGGLQVLNDNILDGRQTINIHVEDCCFIILIPIAGVIIYENAQEKNFIAAGQSYISSYKKGDEFQVTNSFNKEPVNFLEIRIESDEKNKQPLPLLSTYTDVNKNINNLASIFSSEANPATTSYFSIGKFSGRGETIYLKQNFINDIFVFIIEGVFEVEGRLLHARDGLAIWDQEKIKMESLSNHAIILVFETNLENQP